MEDSIRDKDQEKEEDAMSMERPPQEAEVKLLSLARNYTRYIANDLWVIGLDKGGPESRLSDLNFHNATGWITQLGYIVRDLRGLPL